MTSRRAPAVAACVLALSVWGASAASASTTLVEVEPANGDTLERAPSEVVLTFATELDPVRTLATVTAPGGRARDVRAEVDGNRLVVSLPSSGDGDYVVGYSAVATGAGPAAEVVSGEVGFAVTPDGVAADTGGAAPWTVAALAALALGVVVLVRTVRGVRGPP